MGSRSGAGSAPVRHQWPAKVGTFYTLTQTRLSADRGSCVIFVVRNMGDGGAVECGVIATAGSKTGPLALKLLVVGGGLSGTRFPSSPTGGVRPVRKGRGERVNGA
jgi:hypothetical protein